MIDAGKVAFLAGNFSDVIHDWATAEEFEEIKKRNRERNDLTCATHDFFDANEAMDRAFRQSFGRSCYLCSDVEEGRCTEADMESDVALWNAAWTQAKEGWLK
jgi:hypothetical protein